MVATMFVCPGVVDTCQPHWWDIVGRRSDPPASSVTGSRRPSTPTCSERSRPLTTTSAVGSWGLLARRLEEAGRPIARPQITTDDLRRWVAAGNEVGNHSWDHPCLDRCPPAEQRRQIERAHELAHGDARRAPDVFAWPNGNPAEPALAALRELRYRLVLRLRPPRVRSSARPDGVVTPPHRRRRRPHPVRRDRLRRAPIRSSRWRDASRLRS